MHKLVFILFLCLFTFTQNVSSLICYVSNFENLKLGQVKNFNHTLQDCDNYNNRVKGLSEKLQIPENVGVHCYTVEVSTDVVFKGCVQKNGCWFLGEVLKKLVQRNGSLGLSDAELIECNECNSDHCNHEVLGYLLARPTRLVPFENERGETSLKCLHCLDPCDSVESGTKICGESISKSHEAVCSTEVAKNSDNPKMAIRRCQIVLKNQERPCPENSNCTFCTSDLCNENMPGKTFNLNNSFQFTKVR